LQMTLLLAAALALQPDPEMLRRLFVDALAERRAQFGPADVRTARAARDLGLFLVSQGDLPGARRTLADAIQMDVAATGLPSTLTLADVAELAAISQPAEAEPLWRRASASSDSAVSARAFAALGALLEGSGDRDGAAALYGAALAKEEALGNDSRRLAIRLNALAVVVEPEEAIRLLERALRIKLPPGIETASMQLNLSSALLSAGHSQRAAIVSAQAAATFSGLLGPQHPRTASALLINARARERR
jgi:tetratricopeptide (TPR) repeat protein